MNVERKRRTEFGDWQTPDELARTTCAKLVELGVRADTIVEPTCGVGAYVLAALESFPEAREILGCDVNPKYLSELEQRLRGQAQGEKVALNEADFFGHDWNSVCDQVKGELLVVGNFPWVTSSQIGSIGGANLPEKSNFQGHRGFDAMTGKSNFDISEWMLLQVLKWFRGRKGAIGMLVKTAVARKILAQAEEQNAGVKKAFIFNIDAKKEFNASVDACFFVAMFDPEVPSTALEYMVFKDLNATNGTRVGHRNNKAVSDLDAYDAAAYLIGVSPQKWRSGIKHDAAAVMEFTRTSDGRMMNGLGEAVWLEQEYLFPLLKGSDIGSNKQWREKFTLVTQRNVGDATAGIQRFAPMTWKYLEDHGVQLDGRGSSIYKNNPRFSIFGVGDYAFRPWKIAICSLYKKLEFRLVGPIKEKPVMFDDTVYYISFDSREDAISALESLNNGEVRSLLSSMIFWDEKRPIKTGILNLVDFAQKQRTPSQLALI